VEKKFARDTQRARLAWIRAKMFTSSSGGVTERNMAIDVSSPPAYFNSIAYWRCDWRR
jgi:hypothetical protein